MQTVSKKQYTKIDKKTSQCDLFEFMTIYTPHQQSPVEAKYEHLRGVKENALQEAE